MDDAGIMLLYHHGVRARRTRDMLLYSGMWVFVFLLNGGTQATPHSTKFGISSIASKSPTPVESLLVLVVSLG